MCLSSKRSLFPTPEADRGATGRNGEDVACELLQRRGLKILARNVRQKMAEIDIVAQDRDTLVFVEVRSRKSTRLGHPAQTIGPSKQRAVRRAAEAYMGKQHLCPHQTAVRFDAITIVWDTGEVEHFENAF